MAFQKTFDFLNKKSCNLSARNIILLRLILYFRELSQLSSITYLNFPFINSSNHLNLMSIILLMLSRLVFSASLFRKIKMQINLFYIHSRNLQFRYCLRTKKYLLATFVIYIYHLLFSLNIAMHN
ncbi:LOW QUALITY PROTEIN: uncharacterized protein T551_02944 [Pneumocystis jirovecii RU7]|uniref:Transmembrane protein n=1 Tax=Pneumocystis jirovecii (strain RU7) TaxID=1408657 RepID=A0A0W4ZHX3_PNEJ7|nr:LOW QUALITY PROTEIN: uncharacterized protein T551_02944 [Pneumocystis jirovecii RU7]KTW27977.1 LOW QUALITY PROTEIN: hypothetical protein T551_02944 [Pneumocystis jirovecii RU7]